MMAILVAGGAAALSLGFLVWHGRRRRSPIPLVLRVMPAALLLLSVPAAASALGMIRGFQTIASSGQTTEATAAELSIAAVRPLWIGCLLLLGLLALVAALQRRTDAREALVQTDSDLAGSTPVVSGEAQADPLDKLSPGSAGRWGALLSPLALLPVGFVAFQIHDIATLVMQAAEALIADPPAPTVAGMTPGELSARLSRQLVFTVGVGGLGSGALALLAAFSCFPLRPGAISAGLARYGWAALLLAACAAGTLVVLLTLDIRWFQSFQ
jgi:hypothetical protein